MTDSPQIHDLIEHLFRHQAGQMLAMLTHILGLENLDLAEEVVQEALVEALRIWPFQGIPTDPRAWLVRAARNKAFDLLRRRAVFHRKEEELGLAFLARQKSIEAMVSPDPGELIDEQLSMMFLCCDSTLPDEVRIALTLKVVSGFSTSEIARAFLCPESTIAQRIVRAKRRIRETGLSLSMPTPETLPVRLDSVLRVLYLVFNEGYGAHQGDDLIREDLCAEAIRLAQLLASRPDTNRPEVHALLALFSFQAARFETRQDGAGNLLLLEEQDRSLWDQALLSQGIYRLELASVGGHLSEYHLQAGIAAIHAVSPSFAATDWPSLLSLYDELLKLAPSPVVWLNRSIVLSMVDGPAAALASLDESRATTSLNDYHLLPAVRADFLRRLGRFAEAIPFYEQALASPCTEPERRFLMKRVAEMRREQGRVSEES